MKLNLKNKYIFILILMVAQLAILLYFGSLKKGMHFDECFSYFNTNNSVGRQAYDRSFVSREEILQDFYVKKGEEFNYDYVIKLQSYDVHPPVFYIFLHTVCSFMPGVFSLWQGISLNIFYTILSTFFLYLILEKLSFSNWKSFLCSLLYVLNTGVICDTLYIRMYCLMTLWIFICIYLHLKISELKCINDIPISLLIMSGLLTYLGFLTHYFYLVFLFFIEVAFFLPRLFKPKDNLIGIIKYGFIILLAGILGVVSYPSCLGHVNSGYRGQEVKSYLFDLSDFGMRFSFFDSLINKYVFNGMLYIYLLVIVLLGLFVYYLHAKNRNIAYTNLTKNYNDKNDDRFNVVENKIDNRIDSLKIEEKDNTSRTHIIDFVQCILLPVVGYYVVSVKCSLIGDEAMMRYQLPIYGLSIICISIILYYLVTKAVSNESIRKYILICLYLLLIVSGIIGILKKNVFYLYEEQAQMEATASEYSNYDCIYIYNNESSKYLLWNDSMQLAKYDRVYFVNSENLDPLTEESIVNSDKLVVYVSTLDENDDFSIYSDLIYKSNEKIASYRKLYDAMYATCYLFE